MVRNKTVKRSHEYHGKTTVILGRSSLRKKPIWAFDRIDRNGDFAFDPTRMDFDSLKVLQKLISYSSMTWAEIETQTHDQNRSKHHFISPEEMSKEALERIEAMGLQEDTDSIFSFALENKLRIIGIRKGECFSILWYDPEHKVCPSRKRNT